MYGTSTEVLKEMLKQAIRNQKYEFAAVLRDEIKRRMPAEKSLEDRVYDHCKSCPFCGTCGIKGCGVGAVFMCDELAAAFPRKRK